MEQVLICTPDKDLAQCVVGTRVVQFDRRRSILRDEAGVVLKWRTAGVDSGSPSGGRDSAHGFPGLPGWGEKAAAAMAFERWDEALLYRTLTTMRVDAPTMRVDAPTIADVDELVERSAAGVRGMVGDDVRARRGKLGRMTHRILRRAAATFFVMAAGALFVAPNAPAQNQKWVQLFNGKNLDGWVPKFSGFDLGVNYNDTFRVENGVLNVSYDKWTDFGNPPHFGHLFYKNKKFSHYIVAVEYRFVGEQVKGGPGWALRNNGVMLHCQAPETMGKDQDFPISVEAQLLGGGPTGERTTANMCSPGTEVYRNGVKVPSHCINSTSKTYRDGEWVRVEIEVDGADKVVHRIDGKTVLEYGKLEIGGGSVIHYDPAVKKDGTPLSEGYLAIQAESAPAEFRKIEIMELGK